MSVAFFCAEGDRFSFSKSSLKPITEFNGVRTSCDILARKLSFFLSAASSAVRLVIAFFENTCNCPVLQGKIAE